MPVVTSPPASTTAQIRCHHNHRIAKVDHASFTVAHETAIEDLIEHAQHIAMRFLHLIEQDYAVRAPAYGFRQHTALTVTHITRGRALELGHRVGFLIPGTYGEGAR